MEDYSGDSLLPWSGAEKVVIEDGVTSIGAYAFYHCSELTSVTLPDDLTSIGAYAFYYCDELTSLTLPDSVTSIEESAFSECHSLKSISSLGSVTKIAGKTFEECHSLVNVTLPDSVESIEKGAFMNCYNLERIALPDGLTDIGENAFFYCDSLTRILIPESVENIGASAFFRCSVTIYGERGSVAEVFANTNRLAFTPTEWQGGNYDNGGIAFDWSIDEGVLTISGYGLMGLFRDSSSVPWDQYRVMIKKVVFDGIDDICNYAFTDCVNLTSVECPRRIGHIGRYAFSGCISLTEIELPDIPAIEDGTFRDCINLKNVVVSEFVDRIGTSAFEGCTELEDVTLPDRPIDIYNNAFYGCASLKRMEIPGAIDIGTNGLPNNENLIIYTPHGNIGAIESSGSYSDVKFCGTDEHDYEVTWHWADDKSSAYMEYKCVMGLRCMCGGSVQAQITNAVENGKLKRTATADIDGTTYTDTITIDSPLDEAFESAIRAGDVVATDGNRFNLPSDLEYKKASLLGVQKKEAIQTTSGGTGLRFIAELSSEYVGKDNVDYGFEVVKTGKESTKAFDDNGGFNTMQQLIDSDNNNIMSVSCKGTTNTVADPEYGDNDSYSTEYKYVTLSIKDVEGSQGVAVRFYVEIDGVRNYSSYQNSDGTFIGCCASYNSVLNLEA